MIGTLKSLKRNLRSPQTNRKQELQLPADFRPDGQCLDSRELFGRKFFKQVQLTNWSQKHGLAGREISEPKLHELGFGGWSNFYLRHLSAGAVTTIVFCRKIKSCWQQDFCQQFVSPKRRWDIDSLARECGRRHPDCIPSSAAAFLKAMNPTKKFRHW